MDTKNSSEMLGRLYNSTRRAKTWRKLASMVLCVAMLGTSFGGPLPAAEASTGSLPAVVANGALQNDTPIGADVGASSDNLLDTDNSGQPNGGFEDSDSISTDGDATSDDGALTDEDAENQDRTPTDEDAENQDSIPTDENTADDDGVLADADVEDENGSSAEGDAVDNDNTSVDEDSAVAGAAPNTAAGAEEQTEQTAEKTYTLYLTHYIRFQVDGEGRTVRAEEQLALTEADFENGVCDLNRFAYDVPQLTVTEANPLSIEAFGESDEGGARIVYAVNDNWKIVPVSGPTGEGAVLRDVFQGALSDYEFVPAKVVRVNVEYKYSRTGGLAGIDAAAPETVEALPVKNAGGNYEFTFSLPVVEGFRIVLNPSPLDKYLVEQPPKDATPEELHQMLENGDFDGDIKNNIIYYYQEEADNNPLAVPNATAENPKYGNRYSTEYNKAWNAARSIEVAGDEGYTAQAYCGDDTHSGHIIGDHGANALQAPKLKVTLTEAQLKSALENGLSLTVNYRRNATWYTVNHWVPQSLSGLKDGEIQDPNKGIKTENGEEYVLLDSEKMQGRVGALTRASARTDGAYVLLNPQGFSQELIKGSDTTVDIYYKAAESYRVIFDTDYAYIPRQQVDLGGSVDFNKVLKPERKGYEFVGWQYLKKDATPNEDGTYSADDYITVGKDKDKDEYTLTIDADLISQKAKLQETSGVLALHLYPIWKPNETQITVVLWTEDLTGVDDVRAIAKGGKTEYYSEKYKDYQKEPVTHKPVPRSGNANYSNVGSFTMTVGTDSSLVENNALQRQIQENVESNFKVSARDASSIDVSNFYTQDSFEIMHETDGQMDYSTTTANADGKTTIYVYFTRNVYTLQFHYYGTAKYRGNTSSDYCVAIQTNGYSYAGTENILDENGDLNFDYHVPHGIPDHDSTTKTNDWIAAKVESQGINIPQTITINAKYGADLREVWPVALSGEILEDGIDSQGNEHKVVHMCSWATTAGKYRNEAMENGSSHFDEPTIMGLYATMDSYIIAEPGNPEAVHHLIAYWSKYAMSYYRYNHCFELPELDINSAKTKKIQLYSETNVSTNEGDTTNLKNILYLVPTEDEAIAKFGFTDLMKVSYDESTKKIIYGDPNGSYYAVRGYQVDGEVKYYAVGRQVETVSTNSIEKQNPSARAHMTRANNNADHTTQYEDGHGMSWNGQACGTQDNPYDLYFYYDRDRYTITYMAPNKNASDKHSDVELGHITLPYGAYVTSAKYAFKLDYQDTNRQLDDKGEQKYPWSYPDDVNDAVAVCPDRNPKGNAEWMFKGWGLGPAGVNMQWIMEEDASTIPQAKAENDFYIDSDLLLYAIWETPSHTVTFHLNGGVVSDKEGIVVKVPANMRFTAVGTIPRPVRSGYTLQGWYQSDKTGKPLEKDGNKILFDFDKVIIADQDVAAVWTATSVTEYDYTVYYVTETLNDKDKAEKYTTVQIDNDQIVANGGKSYYVLKKEEMKKQPYPSGTTLNLTAKAQTGYIPIPEQTNKSLSLNNDKTTYNVIFYYSPQKAGSHFVQFVEAGTEKGDNATIVKTVLVQADQMVVTPNVAAVMELAESGYCLVNKNSDTYTKVTDYTKLTWLDKKGDICPVSTLAGKNIPDVITYLVQPIAYTITYQNADNSPAAADDALSAVTAVEPSVAAAVEKNPTLYTVKDSFTLKNPARVYEDGKWYQFSHWSLGEGTTVKSKLRGQYTTLCVDKGTMGDITFIANWTKENGGNLTVTTTVSGNEGDIEKKFTFTVKLDDPSVNGNYGGMTFTDGVAIFKLKHGESVTAQGIPAGINYTVEESDNDGYTVTSSGAIGTIKDGVTAVAEFNNEKSGNHDNEPPEPPEPEKPEPEEPKPEPPKPEKPEVTEPEPPKPEEQKPELPKPEEPEQDLTEPARPTEPTEPSEPTVSAESLKPAPIPVYPTELPDPNDPNSPDEITIWEDGVPKTYIKMWDPILEEYVYIPEEDVPMGDAPRTGDDASTATFVLLLAIGAGGLLLTRRKAR